MTTIIDICDDGPPLVELAYAEKMAEQFAAVAEDDRRDDGQRRAAARQLAWYRQQITKWRTRVAEERRARLR